MILRTSRHSIEPHRITAPEPSHLGGAMKLLGDNRDRYVAQSAATKNGKVAPLPPREKQ